MSQNVNRDFKGYIKDIQQYLGTRTFAVSLSEQLQPKRIGEKLQKLTNQHLLFQRDSLGDKTRYDELETLGEIHYPYLILFPVLLWGLWTALRERSPLTVLFASTLGGILLFYLTLSYPQGRYMLIAVPCYLYFLHYGIQDLLKNEQFRNFALSVVLLVFATYTYLSMHSHYQQYALIKIRYNEGIREIAEALPAPKPGVKEYISKSTPITYESWLYFQMLTNFRATWVQPYEIGELEKRSKEK